MGPIQNAIMLGLKNNEDAVLSLICKGMMETVTFDAGSFIPSRNKIYTGMQRFELVKSLDLPNKEMAKVENKDTCLIGDYGIRVLDINTSYSDVYDENYLLSDIHKLIADPSKSVWVICDDNPLMKYYGYKSGDIVKI